MKPALSNRRALAAIGAALVLSAMPAAAFGHASLISSSPDAGENLNAAPSEVRLTFDGELDPAGSGFTVLDHSGDEVGSGEVDLDVADRNVLVGGVDISEPGVYTVEWTVLGADGHEISGAFSFGYATDEEIPGATDDHGHESPDTAMATSSVDPIVVGGIALLALAGLAAVRGSAVR